jgi:thiazole synthase ThiGH ThiG subunit
MKKAVKADREAFLARRMPKNPCTASASPPAGGVNACASHASVA